MSKKKNIIGKSSKKRFINREISWLLFNRRVVEEAENKQNPLLERLKFLSISAQNLDEFFMVRVAGLINQVKHGVNKLSIDGITAEEQLEKIYKMAEELIEDQEECWESIKKDLSGEEIHIVAIEEYTEQDIYYLREYFFTKMLPALTIITLGSDSTFPLLPNLGMAMIMNIRKHSGDKELHAILPIPSIINRFIELPQDNKRDMGHKFAFVEDVLDMFKAEISSEYNILETGIVRVVRDSELEVLDEAEDLVGSFESALRARVKGDVVRLKLSANISDDLRDFIIKQLGIKDSKAIQKTRLMALSSIMEIYDIKRQDLKYKKYDSRFPQRIDDFGGDCFAAISAKDIIVHHPYESFDVVVQFIRQAARDVDVIAIKQTLYRTSSNSPIVIALIEAAKVGKDVTVVVELKARFDEAANLMWGKGLEKAGATVVYSTAEPKVHAKLALITRRNNKKDGQLERYVHYGTGNYHSLNATIYSDLSYFTCDEALCNDAERLFIFIEVMSSSHKNRGLLSTIIDNDTFEKISVAPFNMRDDILSLIDNEILHARAGRPANMWIKLNSLVDSKIIDALYNASCQGVSIDLIVRGICCLRAGVKGLSENIRVKSIVGRFLEHTRIYCFGDGHNLPSPESKVFIASADWMSRSFDRRIEVVVPIENATIHEQVLDQIMATKIHDVKQSWEMQPDGSYMRMKRSNKGSELSAHEFFMANPSLSGRGSSLHDICDKSDDDNRCTMQEKVAVIDIGSNSVRLVIYDKMSRTPLPLFNEKILCGLARNMKKSGNMNREGVVLALGSIDRFMHILEAMVVNKIYCFATSAVRDSNDGHIFVKNLERKYNIEVEVLSGVEESRYAALGIISSFYDVNGIICDLGGGSLELAQVYNNPAPESQYMTGSFKSFPIGALRLQGMISEKEGKNFREEATQIIDKYLNDYPLNEMQDNKTLYAIGGGFRAIAKIHQIKANYPLSILDCYSVNPQDILDFLKEMSLMSRKKISRLPSVSENRVDTLALSALILEKLIRLGKPSKISFSTHGVREGILFDRLDAKSKSQDALIECCRDMIAHISPHKRNIQDIGGGGKFDIELYDWLKGLFIGDNKDMSRLRLASCILGRLAWHEHISYRAEMAFRWVLDAELSAITHSERVFIATAVFHRYQTKENQKITGKAQSLISDEMKKQARIMGLAMRLGYNLSGGTEGILPKVKISSDNKILSLLCDDYDRVLINSIVTKRLKKLAKAMGLKTS